MFLPTNITLKLGDSGDFVSELQRRLSIVSCFNADAINGFFDGNTVNGVSQFQAKCGIRADGIAGPDTLRRLNGVISGDNSSTDDHKAAEEEALRQQQHQAFLLQQQYEQQRLIEEQQRQAEQQFQAQQQAAMAQQHAPTHTHIEPAAAAQAYAPQPAPMQADTVYAAQTQQQIQQQFQMQQQMQMQMQQQAQQQFQAVPPPIMPTQQPPVATVDPQMLAAAQAQQAGQRPPQQQPIPQQQPVPQPVQQQTVAQQAEQQQTLAAEQQPRGIVGRTVQYANEMMQKLAAHFEKRLPAPVLQEVKEIGHVMAQSGMKEAAIPTGPEQQRGLEGPAKGPQQGIQRG